MTQTKTSRVKILVAGLAVAAAFPAAASAHCGTMQGSFAVTCEKGVQVYRHQALSSIPQGLSPQQTQLEAEKIRAKTQRAQIASNGRIAAANAKLRQRELAIQDYRARVYDRNTRGRSSFAGFGNGFGFGGFSAGVGSPIARPVGLRGLPNTILRNRGQRNRGRGDDGARNTGGDNGIAAPRSTPVPAGRLIGGQPARKRSTKKH